MENKIYKEAILDAKALRASAIANAKSMMQEAIEPAIQEMMRLKLSEELEEDTLEEELEETYEEGVEEEGYGHKEEGIEEEGYGHKEEGVEEEVTEATLEEILAELDALEEDSTLNEAEEEEEEEAEEVEDETEEGGVDDDTKVVQLTLGDLKAALFPQMAGAEGGEEEEAAVSLDEILAELEEKEHGMKKEEGSEQLNEGDPSILVGGLIGLGLGLSTLAPYAIAKIKPYIAKLMGKSPQQVSDEEIKNLDAEALKGLMGSRSKLGEAGKDHGMEEELEMAKETIQTLRESINEINLLNAKLLYMNKIFKAKNLTESEKVKVVKAFDRNTNVKEVKNTYETLKESFQAKKTQIKESVGFASKPIGSVAKNDIIEADPFLNRWKKIAGIK